MSFSTAVDKRVDNSRSSASLLSLLFLVVAFVGLGEAFGYLRAGLAIVAGLLLFSMGLRQIRSLANAPPEPEVADVSDYGLKYVCTVCGLELKVEVAARDKAPSHCMEPMELVRVGGKPPLTTV